MEDIMERELIDQYDHNQLSINIYQYEDGKYGYELINNFSFKSDNVSTADDGFKTRKDCEKEADNMARWWSNQMLEMFPEDAEY